MASGVYVRHLLVFRGVSVYTPRHGTAGFGLYQHKPSTIAGDISGHGLLHTMDKNYSPVIYIIIYQKQYHCHTIL